MEMFKVESSVIAAIGYDGVKVEVHLRNGKKYQYFSVPQNVFDKFLNAPSKGLFWNKHIKPKYQCLKVNQ